MKKSRAYHLVLTHTHSHENTLNCSVSLFQRVGVNDMAALELRQDKVLEQLKALKTRLMSTHAELGICAKPAQKPVVSEIIGAKSVKETATKAPKPSNIKQRPINVSLIFLHTNNWLKKCFFL